MKSYKLFLDDEITPMDIYNHILKDDVYGWTIPSKEEILKDTNNVLKLII